MILPVYMLFNYQNIYLFIGVGRGGGGGGEGRQNLPTPMLFIGLHLFAKRRPIRIQEYCHDDFMTIHVWHQVFVIRLMQIAYQSAVGVKTIK